MRLMLLGRECSSSLPSSGCPVILSLISRSFSLLSLRLANAACFAPAGLKCGMHAFTSSTTTPINALVSLSCNRVFLSQSESEIPSNRASGAMRLRAMMVGSSGKRFMPRTSFPAPESAQDRRSAASPPKSVRVPSLRQGRERARGHLSCVPMRLPRPRGRGHTPPPGEGNGAVLRASPPGHLAQAAPPVGRLG